MKKYSALLILLISTVSYAGWNKDVNEAKAASESTAISGENTISVDGNNATGGNATGGSATGMGGYADGGNSSVDTSINTRTSNVNAVLVPNNNTAGCLRVYGLSFGNGEGAGAFGVPFRDKACDFEQAADDAAATGAHEIAWYWRCHKPNLYKQFKERGNSREEAISSCHQKMVGLLPQPKVEEDVSEFTSYERMPAPVARTLDDYRNTTQELVGVVNDQRELLEQLRTLEELNVQRLNEIDELKQKQAEEVRRKQNALAILN